MESKNQGNLAVGEYATSVGDKCDFKIVSIIIERAHYDAAVRHCRRFVFERPSRIFPYSLTWRVRCLMRTPFPGRGGQTIENNYNGGRKISREQHLKRKTIHTRLAVILSIRRVRVVTYHCYYTQRTFDW